jgi:HEAT repeat protein
MVVHENYLKAGNPETPVDELRGLLAEQNSSIRRRLAENPGTPNDVLLKLAEDEDSEVRIAVAENPHTPLNVQEKLIVDDDVQVRFAISGLYGFPPELLERLAEDDENPYVRDHASRTLEGIFLEQALISTGFVSKAGETDKLGEILVEAGILKPENVTELLRIAQ